MDELLAGLPGPLLLAAVALALVAEGGLLLGLVIPGTALVLGTGALAEVAAIPLPAAIAATAAGTVAGGQLGSRLGHRRRADRAPFAGTPRIAAGAWPGLGRLLLRRPASTVALGQWLSCGRVLVPRSAGWAATSHRRFTVAQTVSGVAWAAALTTVGHGATAAARGGLTTALGLLTAAVVAVAATAGLLGRASRTRGCDTGPHPAPPGGTPPSAQVRTSRPGC